MSVRSGVVGVGDVARTKRAVNDVVTTDHRLPDEIEQILRHAGSTQVAASGDERP